MLSRLSVSIPVYNSGKYIRSAIESVLNQTYPDFELIIVDDCSSDDTFDIIRSFSDPRIKAFRNDRNLGSVGNSNRCIELAQGEFINIFHGDDIMTPCFLERMAKFLNQHPRINFVHCRPMMIDGEGQTISDFSNEYPALWRLNPLKDMVFSSQDAFRKFILEGNFVCCPSVMLRKRCYEIFGKLNANYPYANDYEMWTRIALDEDVGFIAEPLIKYRWHESNVSHKFRGKPGIFEDLWIRKIALDRYFSAKKNDIFRNDELKFLYWEVGYFCFSGGKFRQAQETFSAAISCGIINVKIALYFLASVLPGMGSVLRKIKRFFQKP